jgi:putative transposase
VGINSQLTKGGLLMARLKKLSHTVYECKYHVMWLPKYRYRVMTGEIRVYVNQTIRRLCEWKKLELIEMNVLPEHLHLVLEIQPNRRVSEVIGFLKGKSAIAVFKKFEGLRKKFWGMHFWTPGYCVSTIGFNEEEIRKYVRWQQNQDKQIEKSQTNMFE